tara:strand:- start:627 stop:1163 length:537 start_codon:yes stop_codon:yes gene_type:complete
VRRAETRRQRYDKKLKDVKKYPISLCAINFRTDDNLGYLIRASACFGTERLYVVGHVPPRSNLKASSGSLIDYVEVVQFSTPSEFLTNMQIKGIQIVCGELVEEAEPLSSYTFNFNRPICLVVGNEESGVPVEILQRSDIVKISMPGPGYCLNTAQAANILLYEAVCQYERNSALVAQ